MSYCKYHPLNTAQFSCHECDCNLCKRCINEGRNASKHRCFSCENEVTSLGAAINVAPFWRRIDQAFKYPLATEVLVMIGLLSLMTTLASFLALPLMAALNLIGGAIIIKYCFNCLSATAKGRMSPPDFKDSYEGSILLIFKLTFIVVVLSAIAIAAYAFLNPAFGSLLGFLLITAFPAIIILYAITENILEAVNPLKIISLILRIGLPYGLILGILLIMITSVGILSDLIIYKQTAITLVFQSAVANYYLIVMFHIMGYMIFQYQNDLGYSAEADDQNKDPIRSEPEKICAKIHIMIKEGHWHLVDETFKNALTRFKEHPQLNTEYFLYTLSLLPSHPSDAEKQQEACVIFGRYFMFLIKNHQEHRLYVDYSKVLLVMTHYQPEEARLRFELAKTSSENGNTKQAVKLLYGLHKSHPSFMHLIPAYELLADELETLPNMEKQVTQCRKLVSALKERNPTDLIPNEAVEETSNGKETGNSLDDYQKTENKGLAPIEYKP